MSAKKLKKTTKKERIQEASSRMYQLITTIHEDLKKGKLVGPDATEHQAQIEFLFQTYSLKKVS